ncbi:glycosyltransferase family 2 protein [Photobacterium ganghwense]|uniref:glycosyltransferase family 2 protein n=1 Tax=Photobacterium ganghwense TaxID=320778 RepID=UPI001C2D94AD|nr:glycosyltransferase family A protein [Photobacterium ganghwense]MBV1838982.1 glycosyltransferase family 2 protein [Photobacterium ganghwense]
MFSIVIPTYNRPEQLLCALENLNNQVDKSFEVIVVDDFSIEPVVIQSDIYDFDVKLFRHEYNQGAAAARNYGVTKSSFDWIMFLDDDDVMKSNKVKFVKEFISINEFDLLSHGINVKVPSLGLSYKSTSLEPQHPSKEILLRNFIGGASRVIIKKSLFLECNGFDTQLRACEDYDLWIRACQIAKVKISNEILLDYLSEISSNALSKNLSKNVEAREFIFEKHKELYANLNESERKEYLQWKNNFLMNVCIMNNSRDYIKYAFKAFTHSFKIKYLFSLLMFWEPKLLIKLRGRHG